MYNQWRSRGGGGGGGRGGTNYFLLFSERSVVNIDSNDFDKAGYLSTYFHDDCLNASEVGQSSICERIGRERPFN